MTDDRPSIAELQRATPADSPWQNGATLEILRAAPVLLEIAKAALAVNAAMDEIEDEKGDWPTVYVAQDNLTAALAKVRP